MSAPAFVVELFGRRGGVPNNADKDSRTSVEIAVALFDGMGIHPAVQAPGNEGPLLERGTGAFLEESCRRLDPVRRWSIGSLPISAFSQYEHLTRISDAIGGDPTLRTELGSDYVIRPDVTVAIEQDGGVLPFLHAAVSCKWTIRSDRVQNIRHEGIIMSRHRRGRQPHIVAVTAEPLPSRIASIARGTGEIDAVYHVALDHLIRATHQAGTTEQKDVLEELVEQDRLLELTDLPEVITAF